MFNRFKKPELTESERFHEWVTQGVDAGWISPVFCHTHEGDPYMTEEESAEWEEGGDPCMFAFKVL